MRIRVSSVVITSIGLIVVLLILFSPAVSNIVAVRSPARIASSEFDSLDSFDYLPYMRWRTTSSNINMVIDNSQLLIRNSFGDPSSYDFSRSVVDYKNSIIIRFLTDSLEAPQADSKILRFGLRQPSIGLGFYCSITYTTSNTISLYLGESNFLCSLAWNKYYTLKLTYDIARSTYSVTLSNTTGQVYSYAFFNNALLGNHRPLEVVINGSTYFNYYKGRLWIDYVEAKFGPLEWEQRASLTSSSWQTVSWDGIHFNQTSSSSSSNEYAQFRRYFVKPDVINFRFNMFTYSKSLTWETTTTVYIYALSSTNSSSEVGWASFTHRYYYQYSGPYACITAYTPNPSRQSNAVKYYNSFNMTNEYSCSFSLSTNRSQMTIRATGSNFKNSAVVSATIPFVASDFVVLIKYSLSGYNYQKDAFVSQITNTGDLDKDLFAGIGSMFNFVAPTLAGGLAGGALAGAGIVAAIIGLIVALRMFFASFTANLTIELSSLRNVTADIKKLLELKLDDIIEEIGVVVTSIGEKINDLNDTVGAFKSNVDQQLTSLSTMINNHLSGIKSELETLNNSVDLISSTTGLISTALDSVVNMLGEISDAVATLVTTVSSIEQTLYAVDATLSALATTATTISTQIDGVINLLTSLTTYTNAINVTVDLLLTAVQSLVTTVGDILSKVTDINTVVNTIASVLADIVTATGSIIDVLGSILTAIMQLPAAIATALIAVVSDFLAALINNAMLLVNLLLTVLDLLIDALGLRTIVDQLLAILTIILTQLPAFLTNLLTTINTVLIFIAQVGIILIPLIWCYLLFSSVRENFFLTMDALLSKLNAECFHFSIVGCGLGVRIYMIIIPITAVWLWSVS